MILLNCIFEGSNLQKWEKGKKTSTVMSLKITGDITKKARFYRTFFVISFLHNHYGGRRWIRTIEAKRNRFTVCPLWPLGNSPLSSFSKIKAYCLNSRLQWSWWTDLNPRPADYKSAALPTELHQRI